MTTVLTAILIVGLGILLWLSASRFLTMRRLAAAVTAGAAPAESMTSVDSASPATGSSTPAGRAGLSEKTEKTLAGSSRTGIITGYISVVTTFAIVRLLLGFPLWAFLLWTLGALVLVASVWFAARAFPALPWLPTAGRRAQIASTVVECIVAVLVLGVLFAPMLLA